MTSAVILSVLRKLAGTAVIVLGALATANAFPTYTAAFGTTAGILAAWLAPNGRPPKTPGAPASVPPAALVLVLAVALASGLLTACGGVSLQDLASGWGRSLQQERRAYMIFCAEASDVCTAWGKSLNTEGKVYTALVEPEDADAGVAEVEQ